MAGKGTKGGPKPKFGDPDRHARLLEALRAGNYGETACAYAGISTSSFYAWLQRGREEIARVEEKPGRRVRKSEQAYVDFAHEVEKARADAEVRNVAVIQRAAQGVDVRKVITRTSPDGTETRVEEFREFDWRASAWYLERVHKKRYSKKVDHEHGGNPEQPVVVEVKDARKSLAERLDKIAGRREGE